MNDPIHRFLGALPPHGVALSLNTGTGKTHAVVRAVLALASQARESVRDLSADSIDSGVLFIPFPVRRSFVPYRPSLNTDTDGSDSRLSIELVTELSHDPPAGTRTVAVALSHCVRATLRHGSRSSWPTSGADALLLLRLFKDAVHRVELAIARVLATVSDLVRGVIFPLVMIAVSMRFGARQDSSDHQASLPIRRSHPSAGMWPTSAPEVW